MRNDQAWSRHDYWSKLPPQMTVMILQKAGALHMLTSAQFVCTQWRDICTDRSTWDAIRVVDCFPYIYHTVKIIQWAVDRSCGTLFDLDLDKFKSPEILHYVVKRCTKIRRLRTWSFPMYDLERVAANLPLLEDLELVEFDSSLTSETIEALGECCPKLSLLKIHVSGDENAKTIARSMPQLRRICFFGENFVTDVGVEALLDGCTHLESLDIPQCYIFEITGFAKQKMKKPLTPTQWRDILEDPSTWSTIRVARWMNNFDFYSTGENSEQHVKGIIRRAVDKSWGGLGNLDLDKYMSGDILSYVVERCTQIRHLRGHMLLGCSEEELCATAPRLPLLEDLELIHRGTLSAQTIETLGRCCPRLTSLKMPIDDFIAMNLARSMPQLRHLKLSNASTLTDVGVKALLDGCCNLESLDLVGCKRVRLYGTLGIKCAQKVKNLQRPYGLENPNYRSSCVGSSTEFQKEDFEEDIYDVNYMIDSREEYWSRRQKAKGRGTYIQQLRKERVNKNKLNYGTKKDQKARRRRRRREMKINSKRD